MAIKRKRLFTVIMEFEGTTSVSQFRTTSPRAGVKLWRAALTEWDAYGLTNMQRMRLRRGWDDEGSTPVPLTGMENAWCQFVSTRGKGSALLNIIETKPNES